MLRLARLVCAASLLSLLPATAQIDSAAAQDPLNLEAEGEPEGVPWQAQIYSNFTNWEPAELETRDYPIGHGISPDEARDIREWIARSLPAADAA